MTTRVRGDQLKNASITDTQIASDAAIATSKLADAAAFLIAKDGGNYAAHAEYTPSGDQDIITKQFMEGAIINAFGTNFATFSWQDKVLDLLNDPPVSPTIGDRYLIDTVPTGVWEGSGGSITEYNGTEWTYVSAPVGSAVAIADDLTKIYISTAENVWAAKEWESTEAGNGLEHDGTNANIIKVKLDDTEATNDSGLTVGANGIKIKLSSDPGGLSLTSDGLTVTGAGMTALPLGNIYIGNVSNVAEASGLNTYVKDIVDDVTTTFDLPHIVLNPSVDLFLNGLRIEEGSGKDFVLGINGNFSSVTFPSALTNGDKVLVKYNYFASMQA